MAMSISVGEPINIGPYNGRVVTVTGDNSAQYIATGVGVALKGAIYLSGTDANGASFEINTADSSATTNGTLYWHTAIGSSETAKLIILY